jgi:ABC-type multidrug transport system ATPase subunit
VIECCRGPLIAAEGIHKRYGARHVLKGICFEARAGELVAILGENGGGKSTLLRILAGALGADRGNVRRRVACGYCPQECLLYPYLTPEEHLDLFGRAYGLAPPDARARADLLFETFGFAAYRRQVVEELSGGTRQKLNLSIALLHDPRLLLLDEPYSGFDVETYRRFLAFSVEAKQRGRSIVVVTHIAFDRDRFDRIFELRDGVLHAARA